MDQEEGWDLLGLQNRWRSEALRCNTGGQLQASTIPTFKFCSIKGSTSSKSLTVSLPRRVFPCEVKTNRILLDIVVDLVEDNEKIECHWRMAFKYHLVCMPRSHITSLSHLIAENSCLEEDISLFYLQLSHTNSSDSRSGGFFVFL